MTIVPFASPEGCECLGKGQDTSDWAEDKDTSDWFESKDTEEDEDEAPPAEESDWDADLDKALEYHARVSTLKRQSRQPPKVLMFQPRKCPAGGPAGVRPNLPHKPDCLKRNREPVEEDEFEYLEPVQRHEYAEPTPMEESEIDSEFHAVRQPNTEEDVYEPVGSMEQLE